MDSVIIGTGVNAAVETQVDPTRKAMRVSLNPLEAFGHYAVGAQTGAVAATVAAAADLFHVLWASDTKNFLLKKLVVGATTGTVYTTLSGLPLELIIAHNASAVGSGGTALTMNASNRVRQTFPPTSLSASGEIRVATTAALTLPTGAVVETNALACISGAGFSLGTQPNQTLWDTSLGGDHPLILQKGDVLIVRAGIAGGGASGVAVLSFQMSWAEIDQQQSQALAY